MPSYAHLVLRTIKHNKTGLLFENDNLNSLTKQIETLLKSKELRNQLGQNAYDFINEYASTEKNMNLLEKFYNKITS